MLLNPSSPLLPPLPPLLLLPVVESEFDDDEEIWSMVGMEFVWNVKLLIVTIIFAPQLQPQKKSKLNP